MQARDKQYARQNKLNSRLSPTDLDQLAEISRDAKETLGSLLEKLSLSARSFHRILRVARTLADLADDDTVTAEHVFRAVAMRRAL